MPRNQDGLNGLLTLTENGHGYGNSFKWRRLRIGTINISTLRDKEEEIIMLMKKRRMDLLGLCETRLSGEGTKLLHEDYQLFYSGGREAKYGVGFIASKEMAERIGHVRGAGERIMSLSLNIGVRKISLIQVYAPQQGRPQQEKDEFYEQLIQVKSNVPYADNVIILGDMNGHVGRDREGARDVVGAFGIGNRNREGMRIIQFCIDHSMSVMNTFYNHQESHKWTWYRYNYGEQAYTDKSMIDLALTNNKNLFKDVKSFPSVSFDSDHRLLMIKLKDIKHNNRKCISKKRIMVENLKDEGCKRTFQQRVEDARQEGNEDEEVEGRWNFFNYHTANLR